MTIQDQIQVSEEDGSSIVALNSHSWPDYDLRLITTESLIPWRLFKLNFKICQPQPAAVTRARNWWSFSSLPPSTSPPETQDCSPLGHRQRVPCRDDVKFPGRDADSSHLESHLEAVRLLSAKSLDMSHQQIYLLINVVAWHCKLICKY